jgi:hypothetical protein
MEGSDQSDEMAAPTRASSSHGSTSNTEAAGYTSYSSVNGTDPDQNADMAAGLSDCSTVLDSQLAPLNPAHRQSAIAQHQPSVGSPKNGDNRLVIHFGEMAVTIITTF